MRKRILGTIVAGGIALALWACSPARCASGQTCTCDGSNDCSLYCDGQGCNFACSGSGDCYFDCPQGHCSATNKGSGDMYVSCEVGYCSCTGCQMTYCPTGCTCDPGTNACPTADGG